MKAREGRPLCPSRSIAGRQCLPMLALALVFAGACGRADARRSGGHRDAVGSITTTGTLHLSGEPLATFEAPVVTSAYNDYVGMGALDNHGRIALLGENGEYITHKSMNDNVWHQLGRMGEGPGEFRKIGKISECQGNGLVAIDAQNARVTYFNSDLIYLRHVTLDVRPLDVACLRNGEVVIATMPIDLPPFGTDNSRMFTSLRVLDSLGNVIDSLVGVDGGDYRPLGARFRMTATGATVIFGSGRSEIAMLLNRGSRKSDSVMIGIGGRSVDDSSYSAAIDFLVQGMVVAEERETFRSRFMEMPRPPSLPAYSGLLATNDGVLWVVTSPPDAVPMRVEVRSLRPPTDLIGSATFLRPSRLVAVSDHHVAVWHQDVINGADSISIYPWSAR